MLWKDILGFEGFYEISENGEVRNKKTGKVLKPEVREDGYFTINLSRRSKAVHKRINRLVAEAFHGPPPDGKPDCAHIDNCKSNNHYLNLRWASRAENLKDGRGQQKRAAVPRRETKPTIWKTIPGFASYEIGDDGTIRHKIKKNQPRERLSDNGYVIVSIAGDDGRSRQQKVHRLAALAFIGPPPGGRNQCAHIDGVRTNNDYRNLRWASAKENAADKRANGSALTGEKNHACKLSEQEALEIKEATGSQREIARMYGVSRSHVGRIKSGKAWHACHRDGVSAPRG